MKKSTPICIVLAALSVAVSLAGCSSSDSDNPSPAPVSCIQDPWSCPSGQTCWSADQTGSEFKCFNSGKGDVGEPCVGIVGQPECKDGLTCSMLMGYPKVCTPYCDNTKVGRGCPDGYTCVVATTPAKLEEQLCAPPQATDSGVPETGPDALSPEAGEDSAAEAASDGPEETGESDGSPDGAADAATDSAEVDAASD